MQIKIWWPILFVASVFLTCVLIFPSDLRLADLLGKSGRLNAAIAADLEVLSQSPGRNDVRIHLARLYILKNDYPAAAAEIDQLGLAQIDDPQLLNQMVDIYSQLGNRDKTVQALERLIVVQPDSPDDREKLAEAYQWNGQTRKAIYLWGSLLTGSPENLALRQKLIALNLYVKQYDAAKKHLQKLLERQPADAVVRKKLADVYLELGQKEFAVVEYEAALVASPDNIVLRKLLAELYFSLGNYERGFPIYERLFFEDPLNRGYFDRLVDLTEEYHPERTIDYFRYKLRYVPRDTVLRTGLYELYMTEGLTDEAVAELNLLIKNNPGEPRFVETLGYLYQDIHELDRAAETFAHLFEMDTGNQQAVDELRIYLLNRQRYDDLIDLYGRLAAENRLRLQTRREFAFILLKTGRLPQATEQYQKLIDQDPADAESRTNLTFLYANAGQDEDAYRLLKEGVERYSPDNVPFLAFAAQTFAGQNRFRESIAIYEKLADLPTTQRDFQRLLLPLYLQTNELEKAARVCETLMQAEPGNTTWLFQYADIQWRQRDFQSMAGALDGIIERQANREMLQLDLGKFYFERGMHGEAAQHLNAYIQTATTDSAGLRMLALSYAWNGKPQLARTRFDEYHQLYPGDFYTHYQLGVMLFENGQKQKSLGEFSKAQQLLPGAPDVRQRNLVQASLFAYQGESQRAVAAYENLQKTTPDDLEVRLEYAHSLQLLKRYDESLTHIESVLAKNPDNPRAWRLRGSVLFAKGDYREAVATFRGLATRRPDDLFLSLDLAEARLMTGDWVNASRDLERISRTQAYHPAQLRLMEIRRERAEAVAAEFTTERQLDNYVRQAVDFFVEKAYSSMLSLKLKLAQTIFSSDNQSADEKFSGVSLGISSSGSRLETFLQSQADLHDSKWRMSADGQVLWKFSPRNSLAIGAKLNSLWDDPFMAAFQDGRVDRIRTDVNIALLRNILLWNRFSLERHRISDGVSFSSAGRLHTQVGYQLGLKPNLFFFYQFYALNFDYQQAGGFDVISIPSRERVHYLGANASQQLTRRLYYELEGSIGFNTRADSRLYYARILLEYQLLRNVRLRSGFTLGTQNAISGRTDDRALSLDFYYFY